MTGSPAQVTPKVRGGVYCLGWLHLRQKSGAAAQQAHLAGLANDGISGGGPDSLLEVILEPVDGGTQVTLRHSNLPTDSEQYLQGWLDFYFAPMKAIFCRMKEVCRKPIQFVAGCRWIW